MDDDTEVSITVENNKVVVTRTKDTLETKTLKEILKGVTPALLRKDDMPDDYFGSTVRREIW